MSKDRSHEISGLALQLIGTALTEPNSCAKAADQVQELIGTEYYDGDADGLLSRIAAFLRGIQPPATRRWTFAELEGAIMDSQGRGVCRHCGYILTANLASTAASGVPPFEPEHDCPGPDPHETAKKLADAKAEARELLGDRW